MTTLDCVAHFVRYSIPHFLFAHVPVGILLAQCIEPPDHQLLDDVTSELRDFLLMAKFLREHLDYVMWSQTTVKEQRCHALLVSVKRHFL